MDNKKMEMELKVTPKSEDENDEYQQRQKKKWGKAHWQPRKLCNLAWMGKGIFQGKEEKIKRQKAKECYMKMHSTRKTDQAKADLDCLAIMLEEAARKKREARDGTTLSREKNAVVYPDWVSWPAGGDAKIWAMQPGVSSVSPTLRPDTAATVPHVQEPLWVWDPSFSCWHRNCSGAWSGDSPVEKSALLETERCRTAFCT